MFIRRKMLTSFKKNIFRNGTLIFLYDFISTANAYEMRSAMLFHNIKILECYKRISWKISKKIVLSLFYKMIWITAYIETRKYKMISHSSEIIERMQAIYLSKVSSTETMRGCYKWSHSQEFNLPSIQFCILKILLKIWKTSGMNFLRIIARYRRATPNYSFNTIDCAYYLFFFSLYLHLNIFKFCMEFCYKLKSIYLRSDLVIAILVSKILMGEFVFNMQYNNKFDNIFFCSNKHMTSL